MNRTKLLLLLLSLLGPTCCFARLGGGVPDPGRVALLTPSPAYSAVLWPSLAAALLLLAALHRGDWPKPGTASARRRLSAGCATVLSALSGLTLFGGYPRVYRGFFDMILEMGLLDRYHLPTCLLPPLLAMSKPAAGLALLAVWFLVHPASIRFLARRVGKPDSQKLPVWPLVLFFLGFTGWLVVALFRPLTVADF